MQPKYCRYCNALVQPPEPGVAAPDFCNDEHRRQYQDKIQRETIERLRRADRSSGGAGVPGRVSTSVVTPTAESARPPLPVPQASPSAVKPAGVESALTSLSRSAPPVSPQSKPQAAGSAPVRSDPDSLASLLRNARTKIAEKRAEGAPAGLAANAPAAAVSVPEMALDAPEVVSHEPEVSTNEPEVALGEPEAFPDISPGLPGSINARFARYEPRASEAAQASAAPAMPVDPGISAEPVIPVRAIAVKSELPVRNEASGAAPAARITPASRKVPPLVSAPPIRAPHVLHQAAAPAEPQAKLPAKPAGPPMENKPPVAAAAEVAPAKRLPGERPQASGPLLVDAPVLGASVGAGGSWMLKAGGILMLLAAGGGYYLWQGTSATATTARPVRQTVAPIMMSSMGWSNTPGTGKKDREAGRTLTLYRPSLELSDYRVNFTGQIEHRALAWVFRVKDPANYYAAKLAKAPGGKLKFVRWAVIDGVSSETVTSPVEVPTSSNEKYKVQLDAKGPRFTIQVQGQQVDSWTDTRLASGGFGLANENTERAKVTEVQIGVFGSGH